MRKHSVRKWLHALLDLLPLVVIPVFMVYSHRHQIDSYSVDRTEYHTIHMQQNVINGLPSSINQWYEDNSQNIYYNSTYNYIGLETLETEFYIYTDINLTFNQYDKILCKVNFFESDLYNIYISIDNDGFADTVEIGSNVVTTGLYNKVFQIEDANFTYIYLSFYCESAPYGDVFSVKDVQLFNLTQMFGSGNEPTIDEFNTLFPNDYYDVDSNAVAYVPYVRTYNDTDIGSQIFYSLYNSVDKYFNCNKLFSFNGVYNWINFNLFGGNAPLMVDVVYQIIVYEFFMDLIFLIYSVFMFIIDFASNFLEYSFSWSRRGGR